MNLLDKNAVNGIETQYHYDADGDKLIINRVQDIEPILKFNKILQGDKSLTRSKEFRRVAKIPMVVIEQWLKEGIDIFSQDPEMKKKVKRRLNDSSYSYLRTDISVI